MEDGNHDKLFAGEAGDDGQGGVHCSGSSCANRSQFAEPADQQGCAQEGDDFPDNVCSQGYCSQFRSPVFRDEDGGQGIVAESGAYRQAVRQAPGGQ